MLLPSHDERKSIFFSKIFDGCWLRIEQSWVVAYNEKSLWLNGKEWMNGQIKSKHHLQSPQKEQSTTWDLLEIYNLNMFSGILHFPLTCYHNMSNVTTPLLSMSVVGICSFIESSPHKLPWKVTITLHTKRSPTPFNSTLKSRNKNAP